MKPVEPIDQNDDLRPSYDLNSLRVRRLGEGRKSFAISYGSVRTSFYTHKTKSTYNLIDKWMY